MKQEKKRKKVGQAKVAPKEQDSRSMKSASAGNSRPPQSNVTQQPGREAPHIQSTEELHSAGVSNSVTASIIAATFAGATYWTGFRSAVCCTSTKNADGHH
jgi:hypothetical protein